MMENKSCSTLWWKLFYPPTALVVIGLSTSLQAADAPFQLKAEQSGDKYGAVAEFCEPKEADDYTPPSADTCVVGYSNNHASQEEANQHAIKKCGLSDCKVVAELNNACGVIARTTDTWEHNGEPVGYILPVWNDQGDASKYPLLADLENFMLDFCNSYAQETFENWPGYKFKSCAIVESSCPTPVLSLSQEKETFNCDEEVMVNMSPINGEWIPVMNGVENPVQSLQSSIGPFKGCNNSWNFYLKHPDDASIVSNTVNLSWQGENSCELPSFDGNALRIPKIQINNEFYGGELGIISGNPIQCELSELKNVDDKVVSYRNVSEQSANKYGAMADTCDVTPDENIPRANSSCGLGYSNNHASQEEANQQAIKNCGVSGCQVFTELTNACGVIGYVEDSWENNGETIGYFVWYVSDQTDGTTIPLLSDIETLVIDSCNSYIQERVGQMPGYKFKPCTVIESSCPTHSSASVK
ncbi:DUF4189 domain-containing protein [Thiotrichales bacterium HSG1]|nr:DUF4189 domain-containing protein [Thiotrichales bacterium HSG1]